MARKKKNLFEEKLKDGEWTVIFNEVLEATYKANLTLTELKVFLYICRMTWGWRKDSEVIRVRDLVKELGLDKKNASIALSSLKDKGFVGKSPTNICQIQMDTSKWPSKRKFKTRKKNNFVGKSPTKRDGFVGKSPTLVGKSPTTKSEDSSKNANSQTPKDTSSKKKRKTTTRGTKKPVVVSSFSQEDKPSNQNPPQELINRVMSMFNQTSWYTLEEEDVIKAIQTLIERGKKNVSDHFRRWKKEIDLKKNVHNKPGYLLAMIKQGKEPPEQKDDEFIPPSHIPFKDQERIV